MAKTYRLSSSTVEPEKFAIDYEKILNPQQLEAVKTFSGPILCIAGAGSGKTRTLIYRVSRMIESGITPASILLLTFTRKAAQNMLSRVVEIVGARGKEVSGGTYHSFAAMILRKHGHLINIAPGFSILDEADCADIINLLRNELGFNQKESRFPQKKTITQIFSKTQNLEKSVKEIVAEFFQQFDEHADDLARLHEEFSLYKQRNNLLDYDDLLLFLFKLLEQSNEARNIITSKYRYIMADEYQDTNGLQAKITLLLGGTTQNIMVVGDDSQSIYSFRGARIQNIIEFPAAFTDCRIIKLERNYRSSGAILHAANNLMEKASEGYKKSLFTEREQGELPARVKCEDESEQAMFVASRILELREQGVRLNEMAVLFRSSFHAYQLELELKRRNIPYVKWGGFKFLEAAHLKDIIAHLRILQNPADQVSWLRVLLLVDGIGTRSASDLFNHIKSSDQPFDFAGIKARPKAEQGLKNLSRMLLSAAKLSDGPPARVLEIVADYYFPLLKQKFDDYPRRFKDVDQLSLIAQKFSSIVEFLADLALEPPKDSVNETLAAELDDDECLILSTIHSAKGLEWHSVFILQIIEGRFPSFSSLKSAADIEEERRLLYVAMTRAEENLALTYPSQLWDPASASLLAKPSRFLEEIDSSLIECWEITR